MARSFTGEALREVAFPLGGIGTGTVSLGGRGNLRDWEIGNRPAKGRVLPYTFVTVWARQGNHPPVARIAERRLLPPFVDGAGLPPGLACGLPRLSEARFRGEYPFAYLEFTDDALPVRLALRAWNPMAPLDADLSGYPVACFDWTLSNPGPEPVEATLAFSLLNPVGLESTEAPATRRHHRLGGNLNEWREEGGLRGFLLTNPSLGTGDPRHGSLALVTTWQQVTALHRWERGGWWDDLQSFWDDFREDGAFHGPPPPVEPSPPGQTDVSTLGLRVHLAPGEQASLPFILAWHFPNLTNTWNREESVRGRHLGNHYATRFPDAWSAAARVATGYPELAKRTAEFHGALFGSTLPAPVLDAVSSQMSILRTSTCLRTADGRFHGFEGCSDTVGCCPMDCTHVWNYEQALAHLYPALERTMRETDFGVNTREDGRMAFRALLPLSPETLWGGPPAADGQMGCVLKLYREWQLCGDDEWARTLWPHARRALEYAWSKWDADRDGVMEGEQHNTYDIEFYGPNTMVGSLYLAALRAAAVLARRFGEEAFAAECERLAQLGAAATDAALWNGEWYVQEVRPPSAPAEGLGEGMQSVQASGEVRYQYGPGCLSDQLLGQWFARVVGLGAVLPEEHVREALRSVHRYNFRRSLEAHESCQRTYALNDEAGLLLCTWPRGGRPSYPFPYADEVWTGIEYQVAAHLIYEGLVQEGLELVEAVRARHDGRRRNPWDEFECGHHYARALASWSVLLALSGYRYSAPEGLLGFAPQINHHDFRCLYTTGAAWGSFSQQEGTARYRATITVSGGALPLRRLSLPLPGGRPVRVSLGGVAVACAPVEGELSLAEAVTVVPGTPLEISAE